MTAPATVEIFPAEAGDEAQIQGLWEAAGLSRAHRDEWDALMSGETSAVLVAKEADRVLGAVIATFDGWRAYIYHLAVDADHRQTGLGHRLLRMAEQYLLGAGARHVYVMVDQENVEGLAVVGSEGYIPEGEIVLVKRLATRV